MDMTAIFKLILMECIIVIFMEFVQMTAETNHYAEQFWYSTGHLISHSLIIKSWTSVAEAEI
jgi:hypothetical protein